MAVQDPSLARQPPQISEEDVGDGVLELRGIVQQKSEAIGLAIVIGILNAQVHDDVENVSSTFEQLKFAVWKKENTSLKALYRIVLAAAKYGETYRYPLTYKFITFYFAGHGGSDDGHSFVCPAYLRSSSQPMPKLFIEEGIVSPFRPKNAPQLKYMYRLFFFDCCLNDPNRDTTERAVPKQMKLPAHANCLVAYGTSMEYYSKGYKGKGGVWTGYLCENLRNYDLPITTILDVTHSQVIKNSMEIDDNQAPHYVSCVGVVYLKDPQRSWEYLLVQGKPPHNPPGLAQTTSQPTQDKLPVTISENETEVDNTILTTEEGLRPVLEATVGVNNWHKLSIALGLPPYLQSHDSTEVIQRWLDYGSASWYKLVEALKNPLVAQKGLADKITAAHKK